VYVYLDAGVDDGVDEGIDPEGGALISRLEDEVAFLREQVLRHQEIIAQQAVTMRQLTAAAPEFPSGEREAAETVGEEPEGSEQQPRSAAGGAREGARRPWWRRVLGG
jgi:hypothetical protein